MNKAFINIDEINNGVTKSHREVLMRAAEISPFITGRTIGPDLPEYCCQTSANCSQHNSKIKNANTNIDVSERYIRSSQVESQKPVIKKSQNKGDSVSDSQLKTQSVNSNSWQHLDYEALNNSILFREAEQQRRKSIRQQVMGLQEKHAIIKESSADRKRQIKEQHEQWLSAKRRTEKCILVEAEKEAALQQQQSKEQLQALRQHTQRQLQMLTFQGISQFHGRFRGKYEHVARTLMSISKQELIPCEDYNRRLKELIPQFEQLIAKIKMGDCGTPELRDAENVCKSLDSLEECIVKALENIVKQEQQRSLASGVQENQQRQELQQYQQHETVAAAAATAVTVTADTAHHPTKEAAAITSNTTFVQEPFVQEPVNNVVFNQPDQSDRVNAAAVDNKASYSQHVNNERFTFYTQITTLYQEKLERVKTLQTDESMKKYRFACQKAINIPVNAISAVNPEHLKDKFNKLYNFIRGQAVKSSDGQMVSVNDHPLGHDYCVLLMAKKFVSQGDTAISSNPQAAFPVATIIVSLWKLVPDFGNMFLAYVFKESPFLVPYFPLQKRDQSVEDFYKSLGYRTTNGQLEPQDMYLKRQTGIARLYAAVMITNGCRQLNAAPQQQHPYGLDQAWRWLTNMVTLAPLPDISATLIMEMLQIVGADMWSAYSKQFVKLLLFIQEQYFPALSAVDEGGPKTRLELLLGKFLREGQIPRAQGVLPSEFW